MIVRCLRFLFFTTLCVGFSVGTAFNALAQDKIYSEKGTALVGVKVISLDWQSGMVTYVSKGQTKTVKKVTRVDFGKDSSQYNTTHFRGRELRNIQTFGRPSIRRIGAYSGYSWLGSKNRIEDLFRQNNLARYELVGGLFGSYRDFGQPVVSSSVGVGVAYDVLLSRQVFFFLNYYYHTYSFKASGALSGGYTSTPQVNITFDYYQHYVSLGFGRIVPLSLLNTELRLKGGVTVFGNKFVNRGNLISGRSESLSTQPVSAGLLGEADVRLWSHSALDVDFVCQYQYQQAKSWTASFTPSYPWKANEVSRSRFLTGLAVSCKF
ncbi:MAG: hypothetical protein MUD08_05625 [Cytophagales bacterium]|jgi:hypothetical protein|nr:hypothetical protein [Cytophagales bacterium]